MLLLRSNLTPRKDDGAVRCKNFFDLVGMVKTAWPPLPMAQAVTAGPEPYKFHLETIVSENEPNKFGFLLVSFVSGPEDYLFSLPGSDAQFLDTGQIDKVKPAFESEGYGLSAGATIKPVTPGQEWLIIDDDITHLDLWSTQPDDVSVLPLACHLDVPAVSRFELPAQQSVDNTLQLRPLMCPASC